MTDAFADAIKARQTDIRLLYLNDMNIRPCQGCFTCSDTDIDACSPALDIFRRTFEGLGIEYAGHVEAAGCEDKGEVDDAALDAVRKLAASLL